MKMQTLITAPLLAVVLMAGAFQAGAGQQRTFGFTGQVDSFNRGGGTLVVEDQVFRISESTLVHKRRGAKGTLSDITPGTRIGFYPGSAGSSHVNNIWILPRNWKAP
ncbi:MAG: hypothetical protein WBN43_14595, partial [Thiogranum sp.]